ncbi:hypothetical protein IWW34DRAFT_852848 [Fusarium oxysporum f. sp. albedinis]|nr:hypothetical protein IWW34DRAFT_852848 [Fusarium oxysporum f. sp. albedinis]KAK2473503.1 hypothetical protein H9L39_15678 [Fusarium oxysporum f. sp. albedinis]
MPDLEMTLDTVIEVTFPEPEASPEIADSEAMTPLTAPRSAPKPPSISHYANANYRRIQSYVIEGKTSQVNLLVVWIDNTSKGWNMSGEFDVQEADEPLLLRYWPSFGGRCVVTRLKVYHVFKIVRKSEYGYAVQ